MVRVQAACWPKLRCLFAVTLQGTRAAVCTQGLTLVRSEARHSSPPGLLEEEVTREGNVGARARRLTAPVPTELETCSCTGVCSLLLFLLGYVGHSPTKARAPAYTFRGTKPPAAGSCGPGPCYFVEPAITRNGKYVAPGAQLRGRPATKTTVTPGPSEYHLCSTSPRQDERAARLPGASSRPDGAVGLY